MAKVIMVQGTTSNAGKSLLTAGLCRVFKQDGYKVAPFKSQNMALNSYITKDGFEMGRAQVMQAEAAGIEPTVEMNPILLKPTNDTGSQVIINGEVLCNMSAKEYHQCKKKFSEDVLKAYKKLDENYDIIVIEGAGSPAEINLKENDIVNMGMAKMANAPVIIVADIDRGGVFASLAGTIMLLDDDEKDIVKGMVINKFRGDLKILEPGLKMIEDITNKPVIGVLPYLHLDIDDEDSLSDRLVNNSVADVVDIAVMRLPRIANFTDINPLEYIPGVSLRYVKTVRELGNPDMIVLPGTKNTMEDLIWLRESGLETSILKAADKGTIVFGVCGGYQMLGEMLYDPDGIEHGGELKGIGLLPTQTIFESQKVRTRVEGNFRKINGELSSLSEIALEGYEIHMGKTTILNEAENLTSIKEIAGGSSKHFDGAVKNNVCGTYVHGIFDKEEVTKAIVKILFNKKGLDASEVQAIDIKAYKESQYDILADSVRNSLDMDKIYKILNKEEF
ncbi:MAG: cobyric acid synthase [Oscillospiraceae bacterium]